MVQPLQVYAAEGIVTEGTVTDHTAPESAAIESAATESAATESAVAESTVADSTVIEAGQTEEETGIQQTVESQPETADKEIPTDRKAEETADGSTGTSYDLSECADTLSSYLDVEYV